MFLYNDQNVCKLFSTHRYNECSALYNACSVNYHISTCMYCSEMMCILIGLWLSNGIWQVEFWRKWIIPGGVLVDLHVKSSHIHMFLCCRFEFSLKQEEIADRDLELTIRNDTKFFSSNIKVMGVVTIDLSKMDISKAATEW